MSENKHTPAAEWRERGEPDPHGSQYECERHELIMGDLTDDELANAAFMNYDTRPSIEDLISGKAKMPIAYMTAVKERIRWLSRRLVAAEKQRDELLAVVEYARAVLPAEKWADDTKQMLDNAIASIKGES